MARKKTEDKKIKLVCKVPKERKSLKPKIISIDEVYRLINRVQLNKKEVHFFLTPDDAVVADNVIRDLQLKYDKKELKTRIGFTIYPNPEDAIDETATDIDIDFFADEIPESGQLF